MPEAVQGIRKPQAQTVQEVAEDWLTQGLDGRSAAAMRKNRDVLTAVLASSGASGSRN